MSQGQRYKAKYFWFHGVAHFDHDTYCTNEPVKVVGDQVTFYDLGTIDKSRCDGEFIEIPPSPIWVEFH